jgi:prevent-host-death family protein
MDKIVSAAEANRHFSQLLRSVRDGDTVVVTAHGKPVAKIIPIRSDDRVRAAAHVALIEHLQSQTPIDIGPWTRGELYEDEP